MSKFLCLRLSIVDERFIHWHFTYATTNIPNNNRNNAHTFLGILPLAYVVLCRWCHAQLLACVKSVNNYFASFHLLGILYRSGNKVVNRYSTLRSLEITYTVAYMQHEGGGGGEKDASNALMCIDARNRATHSIVTHPPNKLVCGMVLWWFVFIIKIFSQTSILVKFSISVPRKPGILQSFFRIHHSVD